MTTAPEPAAAPSIVVEDDPTPFVLRIAHRVRLAAATSSGRAILNRLGVQSVSAAVTVAGTPRKATVVCSPAVVTIRHGIAENADVVLTLDDRPGHPLVSHVPASTAGTLLADVIAVMNPAVPAWAVGAQRFWVLTGSDVSMPGSVRVTAADGDTLTLGQAEPRYDIHGDTDVLARTFAGLDSFFDNVVGGELRVRGSMAQLSVMTAAFWKVQTHA